jgi:hypothetical protein
MKPADERYASGEELAEDLLAVKRGVAPVRAVFPGEKTEARAALGPMLRPAESPGSPEAGAPSPVRGETEPTIRADNALSLLDRLGSLWNKIASTTRWRAGAAASGLLLFLLTAAIVFREDLGQWKLYLDARQAADAGELELSERKLEEILDRNPDFESASDFLLEVSSELVLPELPIELAVKHDHRIGSCTGQLTLGDGSVEYRSKSHGSWQWPFAQIRSVDARGSWGLALSTHEDDLLGLRGSKNYNFSVLSGPLSESASKRYQRLVRYRRPGETSPLD